MNAVHTPLKFKIMKEFFKMFAEAMKEEGFTWTDFVFYGVICPGAILLLGAVLEKLCA